MPGNTDHETKAGTEQTAKSKTIAKGSDLDTGAALRSAYQKTVEEAVPDEMLDLLGRLN